MIWENRNNGLECRLVFAHFREAFAFMTEVAFLAEKYDHHPEWRNVYNKVDIRLTTHEAGNQVTDKDRALAEDIEALYKRRFGGRTSAGD